MRPRSWGVLLTASAFLGAATAIGLAFMCDRRYGADTDKWEAAWVNPDGATCVWHRTFVRQGCTTQIFSLAHVVRSSPKEVVCEVGGWTIREQSIARGAESERPDATFKAGSNAIHVSEAGLPFRCLRKTVWEQSGGCMVDQVATEGCIPIGAGGFETLPGKPIWSGMIANTVVWGSPWMAGFVFFGKLRRARRKR